MSALSLVSFKSTVARLAIAGSVAAAGLALAGCANTPMAQAEVAQAPASCDTNAGYSMTGVVHAGTKRELDECRQLAQRPGRAIVAQGRPMP